MPPWTIFRWFAEVAWEKSRFSRRATESPRRAASHAAQAPKIPPPTTTRSYSFLPSSRVSLLMACRHRSGCRLPKDRQVLFRHVPDVEFLHVNPVARADCRSQGSGAEQLLQPGCEFRPVSQFDQVSGPPVFQEVPLAAPVVADHREPAFHGLQEHDPEALM